MPRALSTALRARIKADLAAGHDIKTIMATHAISDKKARAMKKLYDNCGEVWLPKKKGARTGRPPKITPDHEERLRSYLADRPDAYIKDMCKFLEGACGMLVDESTMWRTVRRLGWQAQRVVKPRDARGFWVQTLPRDESGNVVTNAQRRKPTKRREPSVDPSRAMVKQLMAKTRGFVRDCMARAPLDVAHDYAHVRRVLALSVEIQRVEQKKYRHITFDATVTELVALMHDIDDHKFRQPPPTQNPTSLPSPPSNLDPQYPNPSPIDPNLPLPPPPPLQPPIPPTPAVESHLITLGWPPHIAITVSIICASISYTTETQHPDIHLSALRRFPELAIVQDADRLDALGAVGIGRAFAHGGARGRDLGDTMRHFEEKLVKLEGMMKTGEGKRMARAKSERISVFKEWWGEEMGMVGIGVPGDGVGVGDDGIAFSGAEMGDGGMGGETARRASDEDPGRQLMEANDGSDDDGESSGEGSSSDSA
ncbi:hypothetical protein HO173_004221 [Letharia columbiana]|uniref:HD/PDEase domain-containing protein n=1 Tax=Letharia columbiana TaxID=112416 RepID=A0A8H6G030_9LECA|nr:uncharacterized protein HO173_004221 [Letharia columbiana]KAF6238020.1 hypothetical protein HO173_004221 [Letharia columbiana]